MDVDLKEKRLQRKRQRMTLIIVKIVISKISTVIAYTHQARLSKINRKNLCCLIDELIQDTPSIQILYTNSTAGSSLLCLKIRTRVKVWIHWSTRYKRELGPSQP